MRLSDLARVAARLAEEQAEKAKALAGLSLSCKAGCGACCRQAVPVSLPEAWLIAEIVESLEPGHRSRVLARFNHGCQVLKQNGMINSSLLDRGSEYFRLRIPCPFLENESCSIYPDRPAICREYLVTSPASYCASPELHSLSFVPVAVRVSEHLAQVAGRLSRLGPIMIPLIHALEWAAEHQAEADRRWSREFLLSELTQASGLTIE